MLNQILCLDSTPGLFGFFDFSIAPPLLFYSYVPIIIVSLFLSLFILFSDRFSLQSKLLFGIALTFSIWAIDQIIQWIAVYVSIVHFSWQLIAFFEILIFIFTLYFVAVFLDKKDILFKYKLLLGLILLPVIVLLQSTLNITAFDLQECQSGFSYLWAYIYLFEVISIIVMMYMFFRKFRSLPKGDPFRKQIVILASGIFLFLGIFTATNILGDLILFYEINLIGPIGMVIFLGLLSFMIVRFKIFNIKLIATQALVWVLAILIGSQFFFINVPINFLLNGITLIAAIIFGYFLIGSVKREIEQKEQLQILNVELEGLLKQRESLVHLVTHKVKGSFTHTKYIFAGILDGTFGAISAELKDMAEKGLESDNTGIETVDLVLNAANMQKGAVKYDMKPMDLKELCLKTAKDKELVAEMKRLKMETKIEDGAYNILGDAFWLKEVISNLVDNAIHYSEKGMITIGLSKEGEKVRFYVKDTGIGITEEDKKNLFTEGGRGKDSVKVNVDSTGYGLYTVKLIMEAHNGRAWAESEGPGKGSTFFIELPAA